MSGNHLVDNGSTVILRGVNRDGSEYACWQNFGFTDGPNDDPSITAMAAWGINAVRLPLNEDCWLGINGVPAAYSGANYRTAISGFVSRLRAHGLYVILSNQVAGPGTTKSTTILPMPDADHAPTFWASVAAAFASDKGVIFDLYNEPHDVSWSCWANGCLVTGGVNWVANYQAAGMTSLTAAVRNAGAANVIMIGGLGWSIDPSGWMANKPNDTQLMVSVHNYNYNGWNTPAIWDNIYAPLAQQVPITIGETGFDGYIEQVMPWADAHGIGYLAWTWNTWGNAEALVTSYNGTPSNPYGLGFKNYLASLSTPTAPTVSSVSPSSGPIAGGTSVTITGTNFTGATAVKFGTTAASFSVTNATQIAATSPAGTGAVDITVMTGAGTSVTSTADRFTYVAPPPPAPAVTSIAPVSGPNAGGTSVTITGTNFTGATAVTFGSTAATAFAITNASQIMATSPSGTGTVDVTVTTAGGTSATSVADRFTYTVPPPQPPTVTSLSPTTGLTSGGTQVTITGTNFTGASAVTFGSNAATAFSVTNATHIMATSPAGTGTVDVTVTTGVGTSATTSADRFTYSIAPPPAPAVSMVAPSSGPAAGGTSVTITGANFTGATAVTFGSSAATFSLTNANQIMATSPSGAGIVDVTVTTPGGISATSIADRFTFVAPPPAPNVYTAVTPVRLLDTRNTGQTLGNGGTVNLAISGGSGVPGNATAAVLNVTAVNQSTAGAFIVYPAGTSRPLASNLNWVAHQTVANLVTVGLGGGSVTIYNGAGMADAVVDLQGYYAPSAGGTAGEYVPVVPARITDTRAGSGQANAGMTLGPLANLAVQVTGAGSIPATGVTAIVLNVTATNTTAAGFFTAYPTGIITVPLASNLNWTPGVTVPNRVIVPVGAGGMVSFHNGLGFADLIVDVNGYFTDSTLSGVSFNTLNPSRIVDTRYGTGGFTTPLGPNQTMVVTVAGNGGVPGTGSAKAVILNVTVEGATAASDLAVWPHLASPPVASDLNFARGQTVPNLVIVKLSPAGQIDIKNDFGSTNVIVDVVGWFG